MEIKMNELDKVNVKITCLDLAIKTRLVTDTPKLIAESAQTYYNFVTKDIN